MTIVQMSVENLTEELHQLSKMLSIQHRGKFDSEGIWRVVGTPLKNTMIEYRKKNKVINEGLTAMKRDFIELFVRMCGSRQLQIVLFLYCGSYESSDKSFPDRSYARKIVKSKRVGRPQIYTEGRRRYYIKMHPADVAAIEDHYDASLNSMISKYAKRLLVEAKEKDGIDVLSTEW